MFLALKNAKNINLKTTFQLEDNILPKNDTLGTCGYTFSAEGKSNFYEVSSFKLSTSGIINEIKSNYNSHWFLGNISYIIKSQ